jgi:hypothetical protein
MRKKLRTDTGANGARTTSRGAKPEVIEEEKALQAATLYLIQKHGMFLVATGVRTVFINRFPVRIITVMLRYPTGHEGYVGDLLHDGEEFTFLTERSVMEERVRRIAEDPVRLRKWNEYQSSTLQAGEG